jgi:hypothetical protein
MGCLALKTKETSRVLVGEALEHVFIVWIFNTRIFHMHFLLSNIGLCMRILACPLVEIDFLSKFHTSCGREILETYT